MAEYIDIDAQVVVTDTRGRERETTVRHILEMNKGVYTAADVRPVVRGEWDKSMNPNFSPFDDSGEYLYRCNQCRHIQNYGSNFCPNCGADMRPTSMSGANGEES